jgi:hypothetical protein
VAIDAPKEYRTWLGGLPNGVGIVARAGRSPRAVQPLHNAKGRAHEAPGKSAQAPGTHRIRLGSWRRRRPKVQTDITEDTIREIALPLGFIDIKVCAVSDVWSGLKS